MARPKRSDIQDDNRREALMLAASHLFNEKGFAGTTVRDIAKATGMQSGSPFYHFDSKQHLLFAVTMEGMVKLVDDLEGVAASTADPVERFRAMTRFHVGALIGSHPGTLAVVITEWRFLEGEHLEQVMALRDRVDGIWQRALDALADADAIADGDPVRRLLFLGSLMSIRQWFRDGGTKTPEQVADLLAETILKR